MWILRHPQVSTLPWDALNERAGMASQGLRGTVRADADAALLQLVVALGLEPWAELRHATGPVNDDNTIAVLAASRRGADTQSQDRLRLVATMVMRWLVRAELNPKAAVPVPDFLTVLYGADLNAGVADTGQIGRAHV